MTSGPIARLRSTGEELPADLRDDILALGPAAVPDLIALLGDQDGGGSQGWPPIHAVDLLVDSNATEAVGPMLEALAAADWMEILHDRLIQRLPVLGPCVLEPALALAGETDDLEVLRSLGAVLAKLDVRDERVFALLREVFEEDVVFGALLFYDYGDARAAPLLLGAIEEFEPVFDEPTDAGDLTELLETFRHLGGVLPADVEARTNEWFALWEARRKAFVSRLGWPARAAKVGRNDPCPCGSGKKFKKCCIDAREDRLLISGDVTPGQLRLANQFFADKDAGRGPAQQMMDFAKPLVDATDGSAEDVQRALDLSLLLWNVADVDDAAREELLSKMAERFEDEQREAFQRLARMMVERKREMFPQGEERPLLHQRG